MVHPYSVIVVFLCMLSGLNWWAHSLKWGQIRPAGVSELSTAGHAQSTKRRELLESLDRLVSYQHYYRSVYGQFTNVVARTGFAIPASVAEVYEIRVLEATSERLLVDAFSEVDGKVLDHASIDESYNLKSNFKIPQPRPEYLRLQAMKHLRILRESPHGQFSEEAGVFRGFFKYGVKDENDRVVFAVGIRPPVLGIQLEMSPQNDAYAGIEPLLQSMDETQADLSASATGQKSGGQRMQPTETHLAQKIFRAEMGRYARDWTELSRITGFQFDEKDRLPAGETPPEPSEKDHLTVIELNAVQKPALGKLEVEPIGLETDEL